MKYVKIKEENIPGIILAGFLCLWIILAALTAKKVCGPVILPDEFGYWAQAANMVGLDWREVVSKYSWYSFGYGFLMLPFMKLLSNPITIYRALVCVNFALLGSSPLFLYRILLHVCEGQDRRKLAAVSGTAMLYVSYLTYAHTTMSESLLTFLYVVLAYGLCRWFARKSLGNLVLVLLTAGYMYTVHMRTIGILLATAVLLCLPVLLEGQKKKRKTVFWIVAALAGIILVLLIQNIGKTGLISSIGSETYKAKTQTNDYVGQWGKIRFLFSVKGIGYFFAGLFGKIFYLGCATFGLYYWGMAYLLRKVRELFICVKKGKTYTKENWLYLWALLSHGSALLITTIYCMRTNRLDGIMYGRYHENTLPLIMAFGILSLLAQPQIRKRILWLIGLSSAGFFFIYIMLGTGRIAYTNRHSITGVLYALVYADFYDSRTILYAYFGTLAGGALLLGLSALKGMAQRLLLVGTICIQLVIAAFSTDFLVYSSNQNQKEDMERIWQAKQLADEKSVEEFCYVYRGLTKGICTIQYTLWNTPLHLASEEELLDILLYPGSEESGEGEKEVFVIVPVGDELAERISIYYTGVIRTPHYEIYFKE